MTITRRPAPLPPPIVGAADADGGDEDTRRSPARRLAPLGVGGLLLAIAVIAAIVALTRDSGPTNVEALTKVKPTTSLTVDRAEVAPGASFTIRNTSDHAVTWRASGTETWLSADPATGRLAPGDAAFVVVVVAADAPDAPVNAAIELTGDDGSTSAVPVSGHIARPPSLAAQIDGCVVMARAEDEDGIAAVTLYWTDPAEHTAPMATAAAGTAGGAGDADRQYTARVPAVPRALRWWVTATDSGGNMARTPDKETASC
jgi:hypothetical protein